MARTKKRGVVGLTDKEERFVSEYLIDHNGTQAAIRAGYAAKNANRQAFLLMEKPRVLDAINAARAKIAARLEITAEKVTQEMAALAFFDPRKAFTWDHGGVKLVASKDMDDHTAKAVKSIKFTRRQRRSPDSPEEFEEVEDVELRFASKEAGLQMLGKHLGLEAAQKIEVHVVDAMENFVRDIKPLMSREAYGEFLHAAQQLIAGTSAAVPAAGEPGTPVSH